VATTVGVVYCLLVLAYKFLLRPRRISGFSTHGRLIVITGCDSGFGRMSAFHLSQLGYTVLAACYTAQGAKELLDSGRIAFTQQCDVTKQQDVDALAKYADKIIAEADASGSALKMWAVINNAGIAPTGFVDWISMKSIRSVMEVNYFAVVSMVQAFLPLLKTTKSSRIVNISSAAGWAGFQGGAGYCGECF
jgi:11-cis-retinol dehydrogenase